MGAGGQKGPMREISDTMQSVKDEKFNLILEKIRKVAEDYQESTSPLYIESGMDQFEVGEETIITFNLMHSDYEITRQVKTHRLSGEGRNKHVEENMPPQVLIKLKKKDELSSDWKNIDLLDLI